MARTECDMPVPPERVWKILADPRYYGHWVVGSREIRDWDANWPEPGSRFHHTVGFPPFKVNDHTTSLEADPPHRLRMTAKARPLGTFEITLQMHPTADGCHVSIDEEPADRLTRLLYNPLTRLIIRGRNVGSLGKLSELAEGRGPSPEQARRQ